MQSIQKYTCWLFLAFILQGCKRGESAQIIAAAAKPELQRDTLPAVIRNDSIRERAATIAAARDAFSEVGDGRR